MTGKSRPRRPSHATVRDRFSRPSPTRGTGDRHGFDPSAWRQSRRDGGRGRPRPASTRASARTTSRVDSPRGRARPPADRGRLRQHRDRRGAGARSSRRAGVHAYVNDFSTPQQILSSLAPYLFHDNFNRRASPRVAVAMGVSCRVGQQRRRVADGPQHRARRDRAAHARARAQRDASMTLRFRLPAVAHDLEVDARVCWTDPHLGLGAQFERVSTEDQAGARRLRRQPRRRPSPSAADRAPTRT